MSASTVCFFEQLTLRSRQPRRTATPKPKAGEIIASSNEVTRESSNFWEYRKRALNSSFALQSQL